MKLALNATPMKCLAVQTLLSNGACRRIAAAAAAFVMSMATAQAASVKNTATQAAIAAAVEKNRKLYGGATPIPGVLVGVWDGSGGSFIRGFGFADLKGKRPMRFADHFRIGSNTKTFVVGVVLQLADEGKLSLDDPISRFNIGVDVPNARNITIRQLCEMRSGLFEAYDVPQFTKMQVIGDMTFDPRTIIRWAVAQKPYFAPGADYHYSNTNYLILGLIVESVTGRSVGNEIRTRLIEPFGLTQTSYPTTQSMPEPWARGYGFDDKNWQDVSGTIPVSLMGAAGLMISDMADMHRWIQLLVAGKASRPTTHKALMTCVPTGEGNLAFGLGLGCSAGWYGYTGGLPGYNTANYYFPTTGAFVAAWVNVQTNKPPPGAASAIVHDIARLLTPHNVPFQLGGAKKRSGL